MSWTKSVLLIGLFSFVTAIFLSWFGEDSVAKVLGAPALLLSAWLFIGHFVTLDDELPGEWSNPDGKRKIWYFSVAELAAKAAILFVLLRMVYF